MCGYLLIPASRTQLSFLLIRQSNAGHLVHANKLVGLNRRLVIAGSRRSLRRKTTQPSLNIPEPSPVPPDVGPQLIHL